MAMNGWADPEPAWWLNLQADPKATVDLVDGTRAVLGSAAAGAERARLWQRWSDYDGDLDGLATRRHRETTVVVLAPSSADGRSAERGGHPVDGLFQHRGLAREVDTGVPTPRRTEGRARVERDFRVLQDAVGRVDSQAASRKSSQPQVARGRAPVPHHAAGAAAASRPAARRSA